MYNMGSAHYKNWGRASDSKAFACKGKALARGERLGRASEASERDFFNNGERER